MNELKEKHGEEMDKQIETGREKKSKTECRQREKER